MVTDCRVGVGQWGAAVAHVADHGHAGGVAGCHVGGGVADQNAVFGRCAQGLDRLLDQERVWFELRAGVVARADPPDLGPSKSNST
jgi:hypothetical protein